MQPDPRLPPTPVPLHGSPRTGVADLGAPRPPYRLTLHNDGQTRTIEVQRAGVTAVVGRATLLHVPASPENEAYLHTTMPLDGYEFSIRITWSGDDVTAVIADDLPTQRVPPTAAQVAEWEASWAERLEKLP